jgi:hypothetical protein
MDTIVSGGTCRVSSPAIASCSPVSLFVCRQLSRSCEGVSRGSARICMMPDKADSSVLVQHPSPSPQLYEIAPVATHVLAPLDKLPEPPISESHKAQQNQPREYDCDQPIVLDDLTAE